MTPNEALRKVVRIVGSQSGLARKLGDGCTQSHIHYWLTHASVIPAKYCPDIEVLVDGAVRCEQLNPSVKWGLIRNRP
jgi:DNA-binding transcriptional regulator YdaS (Cro superfamily)